MVLLSALMPLIAQAPATPPSRLQAIMRDFDAEGFSGVVLVERQGTLEFLQAYGYADRRRKIRNTPDTRFEMASLTKPFTAAAILKLQEQGKLRTSDRIDRSVMVGDVVTLDDLDRGLALLTRAVPDYDTVHVSLRMA